MQRSDEAERSIDDLLADVDRLTDDDSTDDAPSAPTETTQSAGSFRSRLGGLFSLRTFLLALVLSVVAVVAGGAVPRVGFVVGTLTNAFFPFAVRLLTEYGVVIAGVGVGVGALAALVGHYVGRDLRDGLTREL